MGRADKSVMLGFVLSVLICSAYGESEPTEDHNSVTDEDVKSKAAEGATKTFTDDAPKPTEDHASVTDENVASKHAESVTKTLTDDAPEPTEDHASVTDENVASKHAEGVTKTLTDDAPEPKSYLASALGVTSRIKPGHDCLFEEYLDFYPNVAPGVSTLGRQNDDGLANVFRQIRQVENNRDKTDSVPGPYIGGAVGFTIKDSRMDRKHLTPLIPIFDSCDVSGRGFTSKIEAGYEIIFRRFKVEVHQSD